MLKNYVSAMEHWHGRIDSEEDYDSFRWHQWVRPLDLNGDPQPCQGPQGFAVIGFCSEQGVQRNKGRVGTALAPDLIRQQMANLPCTFKQSVEIYDAGDILCQDISMEEGQAQLAEAVRRILDLDLFPIVLGGGHETTFGHYCGQLAHAEQKLAGVPRESARQKDSGQEAAGARKPDLAVVNFDAHFDMRPYDRGSSSGSMFRQIADICRKKEMKYGYLPLGIQKHSNTVSLFREAERMGVRYVLARDLQYGSMASVYEKVDTFMYEHEAAYITICTDVFSSAFAPGVSAPQALGLDPERVLPVIKHILRTRKIRGFDICEISPRFDQDNTTASLGAVLIFTVVNTICKLKNLAVNTGVEYYG
ncbi:MAG: arginase family protein [Firmicutes bacterium]|nr:arginase family protein [Bacillota bacterium]